MDFLLYFPPENSDINICRKPRQSNFMSDKSNWKKCFTFSCCFWHVKKKENVIKRNTQEYFVLKITETRIAHFHSKNGGELPICRHPVLYSTFHRELSEPGTCLFGNMQGKRLKSREQWASVQPAEAKCNAKFMTPASFQLRNRSEWTPAFLPRGQHLPSREMWAGQWCSPWGAARRLSSSLGVCWSLSPLILRGKESCYLRPICKLPHV